MNHAEKESRIEWVDWILALSYFVLVGLVWWGLMARSDILIGYLIPIVACVAGLGVGGAYVVELMKAVKQRRGE